MTNIRRVWWLNPITLLGVTGALIAVAASTSSATFASLYSERKHITGEYLLLAYFILLIMLVGIWFGRQGVRGRQSRLYQDKREIDSNCVLKACKLVTVITLVANLIWMGNFIRIHGPSAVLNLFSFQSLSERVGEYRGESGSITGITTFTEFGIVAAALLPYSIKYGSEKEKKRAKVAAALLVIFAVLRSLINSERLAIIELIVPMFVSWVATKERNITTAVRLLPVITIALLIIIFGLFEYPRSWLRHYSLIVKSYPEFVISRLTGYYTTAINNEAMFFANGETSWIPYWSMSWLWSIPGLSAVYEEIAGQNINEIYNALLSSLSNPEFNNQGGLLTYWNDFSWFGLTVYPILGYLVGKYYEEFINGEWRGLIVYPFIVLLLLELPRHCFLAESRGLFAVAAIALVFFLSARRQARERIKI